MFDATTLFSAIGGTLLLILFPMVCALGIGLIWVGLIKKRYGMVIIGVLFPLAVGITGTIMRENAVNSADAAVMLPLGTGPLEILLPYSIWLGVGVFLIAILPAGLRVTFRK